MLKEANGFGATVEEAKENAIKNLNASDFDDIQFDVISMPKKKVLGLFGGSEAEVRAYVEVPDKKENKRKPKKEKSAPKKAENSVKPAEKKAQPVKKESDASAYGEPVDASTIAADSNVGRAVAYIKAVLASLDCGEVSIKVASRENASRIILQGEDLSVLIGRRGETLDALQYLVSLASNNGGGHYKISLNIGNYREKREETLTALANRIAAQAVKAGKCRTLEPMNPYERRIIHTAVQAIDGVQSASFGEGAERRVVIAPVGVELKPRMSGGRQGKSSYGQRRSSSKPRVQDSATTAPAREPKKDSDMPLYGKIN